MKAAKTRALHRKHAGTGKHHSSAKHTPTAHRKGATGHKQVARRTVAQVKAAHARALSAGDVSCCSAEALAASLRLAGVAVADADVLALYWHTAESANAGASIAGTLETAYRWGLAGTRPESFVPVDVHELDATACSHGTRAEHAAELDTLQTGQLDCLDDVPVALLDCHQPFAVAGFDGYRGDVGRGDPARVLVHSLILGLDLPEGPHAVTLDPGGGVWSWGELYELGGEAVIEEAWAVTWP